MNADPILPPQLCALADEFEDARRRARAVAHGLSDGDWSLRPDPERWSIAEQIVHLNLASRAYLPVIEEAIERGRASGTFGEGPYRRDFLGWMLARLVEPPVRLRVKTRDEFVPVRIGTSVQALRTFEEWQDRFVAVLHRAAGLALDRIEVASPYDPRLQMNLYSFLRTIPAHQRHHLWLAERIRMILAQADALEVAL
jgi:DinB superfamily